MRSVVGCPHVVARRKDPTTSWESVALAVYAPLTFFPLWIVRGEMARHRRLAWSLIAVEAAVTLLSIAGSGR